MSIISPLTFENSKFIKSFSTSSIINEYQKNFKIDVSSYFGELEEISLLECTKTKYRFFYPFNIGGNGKFYGELDSFDWYYMPWKWEHEKIKNQLSVKERILEIGSGGLGFLSKMKNEGYNVTGLELNDNSLGKAKKMNLNLSNETIENFSLKNKGNFDVVCSFQVLEHISQVNSFINSQINCLKLGGKLVISVPNNDSFIKYTEGGILNKPPHHMGLWNEKSLRNLESIFDLKVERIYYEPLQDYHFDWYINSVMLPKINKSRILKKLYSKFGNKRYLRLFLASFSSFIRGHSILIIYRKLH